MGLRASWGEVAARCVCASSWRVFTFSGRPQGPVGRLGPSERAGVIIAGAWRVQADDQTDCRGLAGAVGILVDGFRACQLIRSGTAASRHAALTNHGINSAARRARANAEARTAAPAAAMVGLLQGR